MNDPINRLDQWLRGEFIRINTALEDAYFLERVDLIRGREDLDAMKCQLLREGGALMESLAAATLPPDARAQYRILGMVGHYLAACERHEAGLSATAGGRHSAWELSTRIGSALGVAPRFVFAHQSLFNEASGGQFHTFTSLPDEEIFIRFNALAVLGYRRAANALRDIADMGVSNPVAAYLFDEARSALADVRRFNQDLSRELNIDRFFCNIRPYFKTYLVNERAHRGANAGDFAAINEIDVILGLCRMDDEFYRSVVREKKSHVPPGDQAFLQALPTHRSLLELFVTELDSIGATPGWRANAERFLDVCKAHGAAYAIHHQRLVKAFLEKPAREQPSAHAAGVTSSGPPLDQVIGMLQRLLDLRTGRGGPGTHSAAPSIARLETAVQGSV